MLFSSYFSAEDEAADDMFVFSCVHVAAELIGSEPELLLETNIGGIVVR
jgi:hypothetical protein